ncbi:hypothetical protein GCM10027048_06490 [Hymenobacter coalescens]
MSRFSDEVWHILREAGWQEGRSVNTSPYALANASAGYPWSGAADAFLREFGGLQLRFFRHDGSISNLQFQVAPAVAHRQTSNAQQEFATRLALPSLTVIGLAYDEDLVLLMDGRGRVYGGGCDECLYLVGSDGPAAITAVCLDLPFEHL